MKVMLCSIMVFFFMISFAQQKTGTVSVSHYPNAELYLKADVVCRITDKSGKPTVNGKYLSIQNNSDKIFKYSYPASTQSMRTISPGQRTVIPIERNTAYSLVPLKVAYTPITQARSDERLRKLRNLHLESDQLVFKNTPPKSAPSRPAEQPTARKGVPAEKLAKVVKKPAEKPPVKKVAVTEKDQPLPDSLRCISTNTPSYYTFYYLRVHNDVIYSNVYPVPEYTLEEEGQGLLDQAWMCFLPALRAHYSEERMDKMLNDNDNDLQLGLLHIRDPFIPSATIAERYPYTQSEESAKAEIEKWKAAEKKKYPKVRFVKVIF